MSFLIVPWSPGVTLNHAYVSTGRGGERVLNRAAQEWRDGVRDRVVLWRPRVPTGPLGLRVRIFPPSRQVVDVDGLQKLLQDGIAEGLGIDDGRFSVLEIRRLSSDRAHPRLEVEIFADTEGGAYPDPATTPATTTTEESLVGPPNPHVRVIDASGRPVALTGPLARRVRTALARRGRR